MTDIEQRAREVAQGVVSRMCRTSHNRVIFDDEVEREIAAALLAFHRNSLAVLEEVEKRPAKISANSLAEAIAEMATNDRSALIQRIQEIIIEDRQRMSERANATIRHQAARIAELEAKYARLEKAGISAVVQCGRLQGQAEARADALAAQVEAMRGALEIIAGKRQCLDNLMGNTDVAIAALAALKENPDAESK